MAESTDETQCSESDSELNTQDPPSAGIHDGKYEDPLKGGMCPTNVVVRKYRRDWQPKHAFREFYQNWCVHAISTPSGFVSRSNLDRDDAIREANDLGRRHFDKLRHDDKQTLCFRAVYPDNGADLGFIRLKKRSGILELTNYNARLKGESLGIGGTSKEVKTHLAGRHGEGYKIAAAVLMQHKYAVIIKASDCVWYGVVPAKGKRHGELLCFDIKKKSAAELQKAKETYAKKTSGGAKVSLRQNVWEDVTVTIGVLGIKGRPPGRSVTKEDFLRWIEFGLDLDPPTKIIKTDFGSILFDENHQNRLYLKGILLKDGAGS